MDSPQNQNHVPPAEGFGTVPNAAAAFGTVPQNTEAFGSVWNAAEDVRTVPPTESRDKYTLSVREVARMFEAAGVARSERSIVNWCRATDNCRENWMPIMIPPNENISSHRKALNWRLLKRERKQLNMVRVRNAMNRRRPSKQECRSVQGREK